ALPWIDATAFAQRAVALSLADLAAAQAAAGWVFFDRGLIDAELALQQATGQPAVGTADGAQRYHRTVFLTPPWPALFRQDPERRHNLESAIDEHERLAAAYPALGYETILLLQ